MHGRWSGRTTSPPPDYNFAKIPSRAQPPSAVGLEAPRRSRLEVRIEETAFGSTDHCAAHNPRCRWPHELRGRVGMWCLIAAESAIFSIFVVAYLFYAGKSLSGPDAERSAARSDLQLDLPVRPAASRS